MCLFNWPLVSWSFLNWYFCFKAVNRGKPVCLASFSIYYWCCVCVCSWALTAASPAAHFPASAELPPSNLTTPQTTNNLQNLQDTHTLWRCWIEWNSSSPDFLSPWRPLPGCPQWGHQKLTLKLEKQVDGDAQQPPPPPFPLVIYCPLRSLQLIQPSLPSKANPCTPPAAPLSFLWAPPTLPPSFESHSEASLSKGCCCIVLRREAE